MRIDNSKPVSDNVEKNFLVNCHAKIQNLYGQRTLLVHSNYGETSKQ